MTQADSIPTTPAQAPTQTPTQTPATTAAPSAELRRVRAELCRLIEPGDLLAGVAMELLGPETLYSLITTDRGLSAHQGQQLAEAAESAGLGPRQRDLDAGLARWRTRTDQLRGERDLATMARFCGGLLIPEDAAWPPQLKDLGPASPVGLWFRGQTTGAADALLGRLPEFTRAVAMVGSREITDYGTRVTAELSWTWCVRASVSSQEGPTVSMLRFTARPCAPLQCSPIAQPPTPPEEKVHPLLPRSPSLLGDWTGSIPPAMNDCSRRSRRQGC